MSRMRARKPHEFEAVGLDELEEGIYRALLDQPHATVAELAASESIAAKEARVILLSLEAKGLITRSAEGPTHVPAPPDIAIDILIKDRQAELEGARLSAARLAETYRAKQDPKGPVRLVEVVRGERTVRQMFTAVQRMATDEVLVFDRPPYAGGAGINPVEEELLAKGIRYRSIYHPEALEQPGQLGYLQRYIEAGEEARVHPVPMKMAIADSVQALLPLRPAEPSMQEVLMIHPSPLLDALRLLFELLWEMAVPISAAGTVEGSRPSAELSPAEQRLLLLLTAGLKDHAIANQVGVVARTTERHVASLMRRLGARSRFQAGVQAVRRGWVPLD